PVLCSFSIFVAFVYFISFFFNDTAPTAIYTLSLHDALPIYYWLYIVTHCATKPLLNVLRDPAQLDWQPVVKVEHYRLNPNSIRRSEEHTSELQSHLNLVCRLLLEKKKKKKKKKNKNHEQ